MEKRRTTLMQKETKPENTNNSEKLSRPRPQLERPVSINKQSLLESGSHFGHKTKDWHPKTFKYLYGIHNDVHVINLTKTIQMWPKVRQMIIDVVSEGMDVLFVGTKKQASAVIKEEASYCGQPYVDKKWKGGTLTNLKTMRKRIERLKQIEQILDSPEKSQQYVKKELLSMEKKKAQLEVSLGGIREMNCYPGLLFVVDVNKERIAVNEAKTLGIPVFGIMDSNCDPSKLDYFIPANDDAYKSVKLFTAAVADAVMEGKKLAAQKSQTGSEADVEDLTYGFDQINTEEVQQAE